MIDAPPITAKELFESMVESPPDDTCRTCRFWNKEDIEEYGTCLSNETWYVISGNRIICHETFGCRFHRPKEAV
jgi:hypothetical protein